MDGLKAPRHQLMVLQRQSGRVVSLELCKSGKVSG